MRISLIGHGNVGGALARGWADAGHDIFLAVRREQDARALELARHPRIDFDAPQKALADAEVIVIATPAQAALSLIEAYGDLFDRKILIDTTNSVRHGPEGYDTAFAAFRDRTDAEVVKCFNTTGYENMAAPKFGDIPLDMFMAGDSERAKSVARELALDLGFAHCYDCGGDARAALLEQFALMWINLAILQKEGRDIGFKLLRRPTNS